MNNFHQFSQCSFLSPKCYNIPIYYTAKDQFHKQINYLIKWSNWFKKLKDRFIILMS